MKPHHVLFSFMAGVALIIGATKCAAQAVEVPTEFSISDAELAKISRADILATVKHLRNLAIEQQTVIEAQKNNLADATVSTTQALKASTAALIRLDEAQKQIDDLAKHDQLMTDKFNKANKALWWYRLHWWGAWIMLGLGVVGCIVFAFLKFTGRLAITAGKAAI